MRTAHSGRACMAVLLLAFGLADGPVAVAEGLSERGPITVFEDAGFTVDQGVVAGSGTPDDPFVIAGWKVRVPEGPGHAHKQEDLGYDEPHVGVGDVDASANGIHLRGTRAHVVIRDVHVAGSGHHAHGILLEDVRNVTLERVDVRDTDYGFYVVESRGVRIEQVTGDGNVCDMEIRRSRDVTLRSVHLGGSLHGFGIRGSETAHYRHDIDGSSTVGGRPIVYVRDAPGGVVEGDAAWVGIVDSTGVLVQDVAPAANIQGIVVAGSRAIQVRNVTVEGQHGNGIDVISSQDVDVLESRVAGNEEAGILVLESQGTRIHGLSAQGNGLAVAFLGGRAHELASSHLVENAMEGLHGHAGKHVGVEVRLAHEVRIVDTAVSGHALEGVRIVGPADGVAVVGGRMEGNGVGIRATRIAALVVDDVVIAGNGEGLVAQRSQVMGTGLTIVNNSMGLLLEEAGGSRFTGVALEGNRQGIDVHEVEDGLAAFDVRFASSTVEGLPVMYLRDAVGTVVEGPVGYLGVVDGDGVRIGAVEPPSNGQGILVAGGRDVEIAGARLSGHGTGIRAAGVDGLRVREAWVVGNGFGLDAGRGASVSLTRSVVGATDVPVRLAASVPEAVVVDNALFTLQDPEDRAGATWSLPAARPGTNVVGGPVLGGNAWLPAGEDRDGDGLQDRPHTAPGVEDPLPVAWRQEPLEASRSGAHGTYRLPEDALWLDAQGVRSQGKTFSSTVQVWALTGTLGDLVLWHGAPAAQAVPVPWAVAAWAVAMAWGATWAVARRRPSR